MKRGQVEIRDRSLGAMLLQLLVVSCLVGLAHGREDTDPEVNMNVPQIIQRWGYPAEIHEVTTKDGYILQMHRVPYGKGQSPGGKRPVAFLQHGLLASSSSWVTNLPEFSLAYIMADQGFDVWLGNSRGNDYANKSVSMDENSHEFWKFSFDEMQKHDLDASIDYALKQSGQKFVYYVGHSQGTKIMFEKLSEDSKFATKIRQFHALAPIGEVGHIKGFLKWMATKFYYESELMLDILGRDKFLPDNPVFNSLLKQFCYQELIDYACEDALFAICGPNSHQTNVTRLPVFLVDEPSGTSGKNMHHWIQIVRSGKDQMYNYDVPGENELHYGKKDAPLYDVSKIKTDTYLYWSPSDWLGDETDVTNYLLAKLNPMYLKGNYKLMDFEHLDFIWGNRAAAEIYTPMIATIKKDIV